MALHIIMGLDTHDYGLVAPSYGGQYGFYSRTWNLHSTRGIWSSLEDDVVIQKSGAPANLMRIIPIEVEDIETIMNS